MFFWGCLVVLFVVCFVCVLGGIVMSNKKRDNNSRLFLILANEIP